MSPVSSPACTHDLGVGTTVCLRCRQEQRQIARARQQRLLGMGGMVALGLLGVYVVVASATNAVHATRQGSTQVATGARTTASAAPGVVSAAAGAATTGAGAASAATPVAPVAAVPLALVIPIGRSELADSMFVERTADDAIVHFDTQAARTRRRDKFERVLRATLPALYGTRVDSVLATIPEGALVTGGDLLGELSARGIQVPAGDGWVLEVRPETRPGRDGPLVVRYRARVVRG